MNCPKCNANMTAMTYHTIMVDRCGKCHGIWLDKHELEQVMEKKLSSVLDAGEFTESSARSNELTAHCQRCDRDMVALDGAAGVRFDWCDVCGGMFFDKGELSILDSFKAE